MNVHRDLFGLLGKHLTQVRQRSPHMQPQSRYYSKDTRGLASMREGKCAMEEKKGTGTEGEGTEKVEGEGGGGGAKEKAG